MSPHHPDTARHGRRRALSLVVALGVLVGGSAGCGTDVDGDTDTPAPATSGASNPSPSAGGSGKAADDGYSRLRASWQGEPAAERGTTIVATGDAPDSGTVRIERRVGSSSGPASASADESWESWEQVASTRVGASEGDGVDETDGRASSLTETPEADAPEAADATADSTATPVHLHSDTAWSVAVQLPQRNNFEEYRAVWTSDRAEASGAETASAARAGTQTVLLPRVSAYELHTYQVRSRGGVNEHMAKFETMAQQILDDERGWRAANHRFQKVGTDENADFVLWLAAPEKVPTFSSACSVHYSCRVGRNVIINHDNWMSGTNSFSGDLATYRQMVVNHETGHYLGLGHQYCSEPGAKAPVMMQQSKGTGECTPNPWPLPDEITAAR